MGAERLEPSTSALHVKDIAAEDQRHGAFSVCDEFVTSELKSPPSAVFPNYFQDDGEVVVPGSHTLVTYTARSSDDADNGGALVGHRRCQGRLFRAIDTLAPETTNARELAHSGPDRATFPFEAVQAQARSSGRTAMQCRHFWAMLLRQSRRIRTSNCARRHGAHQRRR